MTVTHPRGLRWTALTALTLLLAGTAVAQDSSPKKAVKKYSKAIEKAPNDPDSWYNLAVAYILLEDWEEASKAAARAVELAPENAQAHFRAGEAASGLGQNDAALAAFQKAAELDPTLAAAHDRIGQAQAANGQYEEAIASFKAALKQKPDDAGHYYTNIGDAYFKMGDVKQATRWFERTAEASPNDPATYFNLGAVFLRVARNDPSMYTKAADAFVRSSELDPGDLQTQFLAAESLLFAERMDESREMFQALLKADPDGKRVGADKIQLAKAYLADMGG